ncbi:MAG: hypothetical protein ACRDLO_03355 [Solirubrobacterales bacterium]
MVRWFPINPGYAVAVLVYLAGAIAFMVIADANTEDGGTALAVLALASLACGWSAGSWPVSLLSLVLVPLATPFGYPESPYPEPLPLYGAAAFVTLPSAGLILVGVGLRRLWSRFRTCRTRRPRPSSRGRTQAV